MLKLMIFGLSLCLTFFSLNFTYAQHGRQSYDSIAAQVEASFNANQPGKIYGLTSSGCQKKNDGGTIFLWNEQVPGKSWGWTSSVFN